MRHAPLRWSINSLLASAHDNRQDRLLASAGIIVAQNPGLTRAIVTRADVSIPEREAVVARVEVAPGGVAGWHTHPGDEISYLTEGEATLMVADQPPRRVAAATAAVKNRSSSRTSAVFS